MLDQRLRQVKEDLLTPLVRGPLRRVHPDQVTWAAFWLGLGSALAASQASFRLALALWLGNRLLDGLDGTMARVRNQQTDWGGYQDIVLDHVVYAAIPLGLAWASREPTVLLACAVLQASYFVNTISWCYLAALLEKRAAAQQRVGLFTSVNMPAALIEGSETVLFFLAFFLWPGWVGPGFWLMAALVAWGVGQRWRVARRLLAPE